MSCAVLCFRRSLTRMEAAAHAKREAEKKATGRDSPLAENPTPSSDESKAKAADAVASAASLAVNETFRAKSPSNAKVDDIKTAPKVNDEADKTQRHSDNENSVLLSSKQSETKTDTTAATVKVKQKVGASETDEKKHRSKSMTNETKTKDTDIAFLKDKLKRKSQQSQAKDNANFVKKDSPVIGVNKSVIFQLPTLRKTPKKTNNAATPKKPQGGDTADDALTNKSMPKWKLQKAGQNQESTAKETSANKHVEPKGKCKESDKHAGPKEKADDVVKPAEQKAKENDAVGRADSKVKLNDADKRAASKTKDNDVTKLAELKTKENVAVKRTQANTNDTDDVRRAGINTKDDAAIKRVHNSKPKEPCAGQRVEPKPKPNEACLARNAINRAPVTEGTQKEPRRYEKRPSSEIGDAAKTEDFDDSSSVESINRLSMQWPPPPDTDKPLLPWKPRIRIINKVGDVLKPDGTIDEELTVASVSAGPKPNVPEAEKLIIQKAEERKAKPTVLPPKPKIQFQPKPDDDRPAVPEKLETGRSDVINGPPRVTKRPKRPCLNGEDPPEGGVRRTSGGRRALVLDRCPWTKSDYDVDERRRKPNREPDGDAKINKSNSDTEMTDSGTTISTTNKTTTSSILRRASLIRRRLGSDEDVVPDVAVPGKNPWAKPRRKSEKRITRRDEVNDTLYLSVNDNVKRRPRRHPADAETLSDGESVKAPSDVAASDDVSDGSGDTASEAGSTRVRVMDAVAKWMNMAQSNNGVDYRRWRRGESTPSAPDSPETLSGETAPLGRGSSTSSLGAASPVRESASWPSKASSTYVER